MNPEIQRRQRSERRKAWLSLVLAVLAVIVGVAMYVHGEQRTTAVTIVIFFFGVGLIAAGVLANNARAMAALSFVMAVLWAAAGMLVVQQARAGELGSNRRPPWMLMSAGLAMTLLFGAGAIVIAYKAVRELRGRELQGREQRGRERRGRERRVE